MPIATRIILLLIALLCGGFVAWLGDGFSYAVEPNQHSIATSIFWAGLGAVFSAPLWIAALIPSRFAKLAKVSRLAGAAYLLLPVFLFGGIVTHNISRWHSGLGASPSALVQGIVLTSGCLVALVLLLWPEIRPYVRRNA
jgi:hypothetical protein